MDKKSNGKSPLDIFLGIPDPSKQTIYQQVGEQNKLPAYAIEKDWWVIQTLAILFKLDIGKYLVFKGGTSLSKSWNLIERFSEDIDLAVDRTFYGEEFNGELGKGKRDKLRKTANQYIQNTLFPSLKQAFEDEGFTHVNITLENITSSDQDPIIISVYYPSLIETPGYIKPRVQIEIGCRSLIEPFELKSISSLVDLTYSDRPFAQAPIDIPSVLPTRTFLEKIFLLHEEFQKSLEKIRVERLSRHLYDIYKISKTEYAQEALQEKELYQTIVKHRFNFTKVPKINYELHQPQTIAFIPPKEVLKQWESDYKTMQKQMIHGESPTFQNLIEELTSLQSSIQAIK